MNVGITVVVVVDINTSLCFLLSENQHLPFHINTTHNKKLLVKHWLWLIIRISCYSWIYDMSLMLTSAINLFLVSVQYRFHIFQAAGFDLLFGLDHVSKVIRTPVDWWKARVPIPWMVIQRWRQMCEDTSGWLHSSFTIASKSMQCNNFFWFSARLS